MRLTPILLISKQWWQHCAPRQILLDWQNTDYARNVVKANDKKKQQQKNIQQMSKNTNLAMASHGTSLRVQTLWLDYNMAWVSGWPSIILIAPSSHGKECQCFNLMRRLRYHVLKVHPTNGVFAFPVSWSVISIRPSVKANWHNEVTVLGVGLVHSP